MAGLPVVAVFWVLAAVDAAALLIAAGWIGVSGIEPIAAGTVLHGGAVFMAAIAALLSKKARARPGYATLATFAVMVAALTPVLGFLAGGWLIFPGFRGKRRANPDAGIRFGNPLAEFRRGARAVATPHTQPLAVALRHGHRPLQRNAAPLLRSIGDRRAIAVLRDLVEQPDARAHLYAQAALATLQEGAEARLNSLRRAVETAPDALELRERLASAILASAESNPGDRAAALREATSHYDHALKAHSADAGCLFGKAMCLIEAHDLDAVPDLYGRLCAIPGAAPYADRLELAYFAAMGNWTRTAEAVQRVSLGPVSRDLGSNRRRFWLTSRMESPLQTILPSTVN